LKDFRGVGERFCRYGVSSKPAILAEPAESAGTKEEAFMRFASVAAIAALAVFVSSLPVAAKDDQHPRTRITIKKRSFLDAGTVVKPGTARYTNYLWAIDQGFPSYGPSIANRNPRFPLPSAFELPGYTAY
jgi:hypothetical protein